MIYFEIQLTLMQLCNNIKIIYTLSCMQNMTNYESKNECIK